MAQYYYQINFRFYTTVLVFRTLKKSLCRQQNNFGFVQNKLVAQTVGLRVWREWGEAQTQTGRDVGPNRHNVGLHFGLHALGDEGLQFVVVIVHIVERGRELFPAVRFVFFDT